MTKFVAIAILGLFLLPSTAFAQYHPDPQINSVLSLLIEQVKVLQERLADIEKEQDARESTSSRRETTEDEIARLTDTLESLIEDRDAWLSESKSGEECASKTSRGIKVSKPAKVQKRCDALEEKYTTALRRIPLVEERLDVLQALKRK